jgi:hypothetical protein
MSDDKSKSQSESKRVSRRDFVRKGAKVAYVTPLVLAAVNAAERPASAGSFPPVHG